ncbi:hypothetical protein LXL04_037784 [Taraxacum kok-saghyz]
MPMSKGWCYRRQKPTTFTPNVPIFQRQRLADLQLPAAKILQRGGVTAGKSPPRRICRRHYTPTPFSLIKNLHDIGNHVNVDQVKPINVVPYKASKSSCNELGIKPVNILELSLLKLDRPPRLEGSSPPSKLSINTLKIKIVNSIKVLGSFENSYIPENPRTPPISYISQTVIPFKKPTSEPSKTFETKQKTVHICTKKKFAHMQSFWEKKIVRRTKFGEKVRRNPDQSIKMANQSNTRFDKS